MDAQLTATRLLATAARAQTCQKFVTGELVSLLGDLAESPRAQDRLYARCLLLHCYASSAPRRHQVRAMVESQMADVVQDSQRRSAVPFIVLTHLELVTGCAAGKAMHERPRSTAESSPLSPRPALHSMAQGFRVPLRRRHRTAFVRYVLPLHKHEHLHVFLHELFCCIVQVRGARTCGPRARISLGQAPPRLLVLTVPGLSPRQHCRRDPSLLPDTLRYISQHWPRRGVRKQYAGGRRRGGGSVGQ